VGRAPPTRSWRLDPGATTPTEPPPRPGVGTHTFWRLIRCGDPRPSRHVGRGLGAPTVPAVGSGAVRRRDAGTVRGAARSRLRRGSRRRPAMRAAIREGSARCRKCPEPSQTST
jgi:hypothetical protein